jgi:hypothetical protein
MKVRMSRKINVAPYETFDYEITLDSDEFPSLSFEELREKAYTEIVAMEIFKECKTREQGLAEIQRYRKFFSKKKEVFVNDGGR